jgi:type I restriction enzyme R subunit
MTLTVNFGFLSPHSGQLVQLAARAESYFGDDPGTCIFKLRQFAELLCKTIASNHALYQGERETFDEMLRRLSYERIIPKEAANLFHALRITGNLAAHGLEGDHSDALSALKLARQLGIWFHRTYGRQPDFKPGPFVRPTDSAASLQEEIEALRRRVTEAEAALERARQEAEEHARAREAAEQRLAKEAEERAIWEHLAQEAENAAPSRAEAPSRATSVVKPAESAFAPDPSLFDAHQEQIKELAAVQARARQTPKSELQDLVLRGEQAASKIDLDEASTVALHSWLVAYAKLLDEEHAWLILANKHRSTD